MDNDYFKMGGSFSRVQYFASLFLTALVWGFMVLIFKGPAQEQFVQSNVLPDAITITPPLLVFLFAALKRFRHIGSAWWLCILFLSSVILLAISDLIWPDFSTRYSFYQTLLMVFWVAGTILLLVWPSPGDKTPGVTAD